MRVDDFDFDLPERLIALRPARPRSSARMLVARAGTLSDQHMADLPDQLNAGDLLVFNDTAVISARLFGQRHRGDLRAGVEIMLDRMTEDGRWRALAKPLKKLKEGDVVHFEGGLSAEILRRDAAAVWLSFNRAGGALLDALAQAGQVPLPPYIAQRRAVDDQDAQDYQTIFAEKPGAVAAPTASLHFDDPLMAALAARGVQFCHVTLHVGAGTFLPVTAEQVEDHVMHVERGMITAEAAEAINTAKAAGRRVIPVGTTALRLVESAAQNGRVAPYQGETGIFITPGYTFQIADGLITNFHLPRSTLIMLVAAMIGMDTQRRLYRHAIDHGYRFYSYGDGSLLLPNG